MCTNRNIRGGRSRALSLIFGWIITSVLAQGPSCPVLNEADLSFELVKSTIQNPSCNVRTITDFLKILPASYRSQYAAFYRSRSIQGPFKADFKNPRVIIYGQAQSPKLIISINGDSKQPGNSGLEIAEINTAGGKDNLDVFKYYEANFPYSEDKINNRSWAEVQKDIKFSDANPSRCTACHGLPARPIYPGYPNWEGSFGSMHLGSPSDAELKGIKEYVEKVKAPGNSRYHQLETSSLLRATDLNGSHEPFFRESNSGLNFHLGNANAVRVARLAIKTPDYEKFRYALMGSFLRCNNFENFLAPQPKAALLGNIEKSFGLKANWPENKQNDLIKNIYIGPTFIISSLGKSNGDKNTFPEFAKQFRKDLGGSADFQRLQLDTFSIQGVSRADPLGANLRLIMEGRGINIDDWFLDLTQPTYRYHNGANAAGETIKELVKIDPGIDQKLLDPLKDYLKNSNSDSKESICQRLKQMSQKSLDGVEIPKLAANSKQNNSLANDETAKNEAPSTCGPRSGLVDRNQQLRAVADSCMAKNYPSVFTNRCARCHDQEKKDTMAPDIPFSNPQKMYGWLSEEGNKSLIRSRLLTSDEAQRMPPTRRLTKEELESVSNYITKH